MKNAIFSFPLPANEPVKTYLKGSPEREALEAELKKQSSQVIEIPLILSLIHIFIVTDRTVDVNITRLRRKLGPLGSCVKTRIGYGYSFETE